MFVQVVSLCEHIKQSLSTEAETDLPDNVSKETFPIKKHVTVMTPVSVEHLSKSLLLKHGDLIVLFPAMSWKHLMTLLKIFYNLTMPLT